MALSTRGRGAHSAPSGVTTSFRPPRFLNVSGMWTVIVSPSAETVARVTPPPSCCPPLRAPARRARSAAAGPRRRASARRRARPAAARSAPARRGTARPTAGRAASLLRETSGSFRAGIPKRAITARALPPVALRYTLPGPSDGRSRDTVRPRRRTARAGGASHSPEHGSQRQDRQLARQLRRACAMPVRSRAEARRRGARTRPRPQIVVPSDGITQCPRDLPLGNSRVGSARSRVHTRAGRHPPCRHSRKRIRGLCERKQSLCSARSPRSIQRRRHRSSAKPCGRSPRQNASTHPRDRAVSPAAPTSAPAQEHPSGPQNLVGRLQRASTPTNCWRERSRVQC